MPELPEVETVRTGLEAAMKGACIKSVTLWRGDLRTAFPDGFVKALEGACIKAVKRRAKYLLFVLDNGMVLIAHLGMTGWFSVLEKKPKAFGTHDHVVFALKDGRVVVFNDARRFGMMGLARAGEVWEHKAFVGMGPEPLEKGFSAAYLKGMLLKRKIAVKVALMDQKLVVGVGNIYASEALFLCKIDPRRPAEEVADKAAAMVKAIRRVLEDAIASGGSSLRDFLDVNGESGYFQHHFNVYGRAGKPCLKCGTDIVSIRQAGRSTFFCPHCQH